MNRTRRVARRARHTVEQAGNSLDKASLLIALLRASGIPAQYATGTWSSRSNKQLILSMFPAQTQLTGYVATGATLSDPANDPETPVRGCDALLGAVRQRQRHAGRRRSGFCGRVDRANVHRRAGHVHRRSLQSEPNGHGKAERRDVPAGIFSDRLVDHARRSRRRSQPRNWWGIH